MTRRITRIWGVIAICFFVSSFLFIALSFGQEMPKPGEVIDKSSYKKYAHLFPEEWLPGFEDGWGGLMKPMVIKVSATVPGGQPKAYLTLSEKNRGKYGIDKDGFISGGYDYTGLPFPDLDKNDKDFTTKLMWNFNYKYRLDDMKAGSIQYTKRKGESLYWFIMWETNIKFINRLYASPKPFYKTPVNLDWAFILHDTEPADIKDFITLNYRYLDPRKPDDVYLYLPTMRRVLRGEAGQRSTPIQGIPSSLDDFFGGFDGKIQEFNYKFLREQKILALTEANMTVAQGRKEAASGWPPFPSENWSVRDVYVIEITAKDPRYPQGRKVIYVDKEGLWCLYGVAYDRAGKLWKIFQLSARRDKLPDGDTQMYLAGQISLDMQFGMGTSFYADFLKLTGNNITYADVMPSALIKMVK